MKVLHVYNRHRGGGGADNTWDQTIRYSDQHGIKVEVFSRDSKAVATTLGGKVVAFVSGIYPRNAVKEFREALAVHKPDLVHAHELMPLITPWIFPECAKAGVPIVNTIYDLRLTCPVFTHFRNGQVCHLCEGGREYQAVVHNCRGNYGESLAFATWNVVARKFKLHATHVSRFIAPSPFVRDWLIAQGISDDRISVVSPTVAVQEIRVDPARGEYIAYAGRFVVEKGVEILIRAARKAGLPVKLAGNFPTHPAIGPGDAVECVSTKSPAELAAFYKGARMLVMPSIWYETFGIVAVEAMSHGIPVIASRIGALKVTVEENVTGLLFEPNNVDELAEKITRLWHDPALARRLGEAGFNTARANYSPSVSFERLLTAYDQALRNPRTTKA